MGAGALAGMTLFPRGVGSQNIKDSAKIEAGEKKSEGDPPVRIPIVSIRMRSPDSLLFGVTTSEIIEIRLGDVLKFHGYCAGRVELPAWSPKAKKSTQTRYSCGGFFLTKSPEGRSLYSQK
jgi:hypothetical protein